MDTLNFSPELRKSWLVQRLLPPLPKGRMTNLTDSLSFGGGLENGGLSKSGRALLNEIFSFDYMGAAEFEFGIVASCFSFLASNVRDLVAGSVSVKEGKPTVYYLCHKAHAEQVPGRIRLLATNPPPAKESVSLVHYFEDTRFKTRAVGWLDCSNGFMFFVDKEMFEKVCKLLGVNIDERV